MSHGALLAGMSRRLLGREPTVLRAGVTIATCTTIVAVAGGLLMRLADPEAFPSLGRGLWWAVQTVTTVGYGDVVPTTVAGRAIAAIVMLAGIAFISVLTAAIVAALIESARRRLEAEAHDSTHAKLDEITARLAALEAAVKSRPS
jgi:voltage-gated potassium channel